MLTRKCDMCENPAVVDAKTIYGYWAYLCEDCNKMYGLKNWQTKLANLTEGGTPIACTISEEEEFRWKQK